MQTTIPSLSDPRVFKRAVKYLLESDPKLGKIIETHGAIKFKSGGDIFESLVESILSQQLAGPAADAIISRVKALYGKGLHAAALYKTPVAKLRKAGVSPQKIRYLKDLSSRVVKGTLNLTNLHDKPDADLIEDLDQVLGIGPWTAQMLLIFNLGRTDVLPVDDLGIRKSIQQVYSLDELPKRKTIEEIALAWHPYCTVASLYLWRAKDTPLPKALDKS